MIDNRYHLMDEVDLLAERDLFESRKAFYKKQLDVVDTELIGIREALLKIAERKKQELERERSRP